MANIKSQIKRIRTNERARVRNVATRSKLRTQARRFQEAIKVAMREACRAYDKAAADGVIHKNNAANHKAKLAKAFNAVAS